MNKVLKKYIDCIFNKTKKRNVKHWLWKHFYQNDFITEINNLINQTIDTYTFNKLIECWYDDLSDEEVAYYYPGFPLYNDVFGRLVYNYNKLKPIEKDSYPLISKYMYSGIVYRVLDNEEIIYNNEIASWTRKYQWMYEVFNGDHYGLEKTILIGKTNNDYGFDFYSYGVLVIKHPKHYMFIEQEVILPMNECYVVEKFRGTWNEFKAHVKQLNLIDNKD